MDIDSTREITEIVIGGMTKGEFIAVLLLGGIVIGGLMWYLQRLVAPLRESLKETALDIKNISLQIRSPEEIKDLAKNTVFEHVINCEGKKLLPKVLDVIDKNSQTNHELATAINNFNNNHGVRL